MHREAAQKGFVFAMRFRGIDDIIAAIDPVTDQLFDQGRRMLAVAVHEQHGAPPCMVQPRHQGRFLAEIARQRHHLHVERIRCEAIGNCERRIGAAVVDIDDLAGQRIALPQRPCQNAKPFVQRCEPGGLVVDGDDDRQTLRRGGRRGGR